MASASVLDPPLPKTYSRPPWSNRSAIADAHAASAGPSDASIVSRSLPISTTLSRVERETSVSSSAALVVRPYRKGYRDSVVIAAAPF